MADNVKDADMEELIIKQAPRSIQMEMAQKIKEEKHREATLKVGYNRSMIKNGEGGGSGEMKYNKSMTSANSAVVMKESSGNINNYATPAKNETNTAAFLSTFGKHSLMHRVANSPRPFATVGKGSKMMGTNFPQSMGSTMDATSGGGADEYMETTKASPFRETVTKGLITGVGFLNKQPNLGHTN